MDMNEYLAERGLVISPEMQERAHRATLDKIEAYNLSQARKERHITQVELAKQMGVGQSRVSEIENGDLGSAQLDTIRRYVESLGAKLVMNVEWPDKTIRLA